MGVQDERTAMCLLWARCRCTREMNRCIGVCVLHVSVQDERPAMCLQWARRRCTREMNNQLYRGLCAMNVWVYKMKDQLSVFCGLDVDVQEK